MADKPSRSTLPGNPEDLRQKDRNEFFRRSLCDHCRGTGNELFSLYRRCTVCGGTGIEPIAWRPDDAGIGPGMLRVDGEMLEVLLARYLATYGIPETDGEGETDTAMTTDEVLGHLRTSLGGR